MRRGVNWDYKNWRSYVQPLSAGLLIALALPPWGWWPLLFLGILYWLYLLDTPSWQSRFANSFLVVLAWLLFSLIWIWDLTAIGYLITAIAFAILYGIGGVLVPPSKLANKAGWLAFPAVLVLGEHIRSRWPFGGVPLSTLAMGLVDSFFAHLVRLGGQLLLVFLIGVLAVGVLALIKKSYWIGGAVVLAAILLTVFSGFAPTSSTTGETLEIAIVQGGGSQRVRAKDSNPREVFERHLSASKTLIQKPVDLVVWPENVLDLPRFQGSLEEQELRDLAVELETYLFVGVVEDFDEDTFLNYSVLFSPTGEQVDLYEKVRRVPFGEYVPFRGIIEPFAPDFLPSTESRVGKGAPVVTDGKNVFGTAISWEIFFEDRLRAAARAGAQILINPTNNSSFWLGIVQSQQIASSKLRAMETGLWVVQAAPTGFSAFVDSSGGVKQKTSIGEQAVLQMEVELREGKTWATRLGVWYLVGISLGLILLAWAIYFRRYFK